MSLIYDVSFDSTTRVLSLLDKAGNVISSCEVPSKDVDDLTKPLTFKATKDGSTVTLTKSGSPSGAFQTSTDGGNTWTDYTIGASITLNTGDEVSFRAKANRTSAQSFTVNFYFKMTGKIEAWHNVMSLYRTSDFATYNTLVESAFNHLFAGCGSSLTKAPVLPTTLAKDCYEQMFAGCSSLTKAPELPATTLVFGCYSGMFIGCYSLTKAPVLPATTLADYCYYRMFESCKSLTEAPELPATTLAKDCYNAMFDGCRDLAKAPELPATTLAINCYSVMFAGCTSLTKSPELPATTLAQSCYSNMFSGCGSLNEVRCQMSSKYSSSEISSYAKDWLSYGSSTGTFYTNADAKWSRGVSGIPEGWTRVNEGAPTVDDITKPLTFKATQDGSTVKLKNFNSPIGAFQTSTDGGNTWTDYTLDTAITLNTGDEVSFRAKTDRTSKQNPNDIFYFAMTGKIEAWHNVMSLYRTRDFATYESVVGYAFSRLFRNCTSLTKAPALPATTLAPSCYQHMFDGCQSLTEAPELPATTLAEDCYSNMFDGCQSLTKAPALPATTLAMFCYWEMFKGCQSLKEVRVSATTTAERPLSNWLSGVSATGDFYCDPNATIFPTGSASGIPANWTRRNIADYPN